MERCSERGIYVPTNWISWFFYNLRFLGEFQIQRVGQNLQKLQFSASNETTEMLTLSCMPCSSWFNSQRVRILRRSKSIPNSLKLTEAAATKMKISILFSMFYGRQERRQCNIATIVSFSKFMPQEKHLLRIYVYGGIRVKVLFQREQR